MGEDSIMNRRIICFTLIILVTLSFICPSSALSYGEKETSKIHYNSIVIDSHNDTMMTVIDEETWLPKINIGENTKNHIDIPKLKAGGLDVPFFAAYTAGYYDNDSKSLSRTLALINALYWTERNNRDTFKIVKTIDEIEKIVKDGKIAAVSTIEGGYSFNEDNALELINQYYDLGVRVVGFNWNYSNHLGEGSSRKYNDSKKTPSSGGLTKLGEKLAIEMNRLGMVIDVSHMAESTFWDIINISKAPVIASHSGVYFLRNHPRNLTDEQLKALAKNRGVIGIVFYPDFLTNSNSAYIKDYVDHIDYVVNLIGIDHVGMGSDFDGATLPNDIKDSSELYKVTEELVRRGYSKEDIEKLLGKNTLRVLQEVQKIAENNYKDFKKNLYIIPEFKMDEIILDSTPLLTAKIESLNGIKIDETKSRIIVDGISYKPRYNEKTSNLFLKIRKPLKEKFHVVTFEVWDNKGNIQRQTRIFYIK